MNRPFILYTLLCIVVAAMLYVATKDDTAGLEPSPAAATPQVSGPVLPKGAVALRDAPDLVIDGATWTTQLVDSGSDHNNIAIWVVLTPPDGTRFSDASEIAQRLHAACDLILAELDGFNHFGVTADRFDHIDLNIRIGRSFALPYDVSLSKPEGSCVTNFLFDRAVPDAGTASGHAYEDHVRANLLSWGLKRAEIALADDGAGDRIEVTFDVLPEFGRRPEAIDGRALCILALVSMDQVITVQGQQVELAQMREITLRLRRSSGLSVLNLKQPLGSLTLGLEDGKCGEKLG